MSRRGRSTQVNRFQDGSRASIGDYYVDQAVNTLTKNCAVECAMFVPALDRHKLIPMLFDDVGIERLRAALPFAAGCSMTQTYELNPHVNGTLGFNWDGLGIYPAEKVRPHMDRYAPFITALQEIQALRAKWGSVIHVLKWCNRNLTPGAIRNLWPSAMALCPDSPAMIEIKREAPVRYASPAQLGEYLPLLRYTAGVVAASKMLPSDMQPRKREGIWLTLAGETVRVEDCPVPLEQWAFNLG